MPRRVPCGAKSLLLQGGIVLLYTNAMRLGLLAEPSTAEQMEKLLDGLLAPDERMIRGPNGMELGACIRGVGRTLPVILTDGSRVPVSRRKYEKVRNQYMVSVRLCMQ